MEWMQNQLVLFVLQITFDNWWSLLQMEKRYQKLISIDNFIAWDPWWYLKLLLKKNFSWSNFSINRVSSLFKRINQWHHFWYQRSKNIETPFLSGEWVSCQFGNYAKKAFHILNGKRAPTICLYFFANDCYLDLNFSTLK